MTDSNRATTSDYVADDIVVYRTHEHIRRRPALYIGSTGQLGLQRLVLELVNNSLEEFMTGFGRSVVVELLADGGCRVSDEGRGFPVDPSTASGKEAFQLLCTEVLCPGPYKQYRVEPFRGLGLIVVNALSRRMVVEVKNHGHLWRQEFVKGEAISSVCAIREDPHTGTTITFWPDPEVFFLGPDGPFSHDLLYTRLRELAFFFPNVTFCLIDETSTRKENRFHFSDGLCDYVRLLNQEARPIHPHLFHLVESSGTNQVEIALQWIRSTEENTKTYCNTHLTVNGGTHQTGFRAGLTGALMKLLREHGWHPSRRLFRDIGMRCRRGLTGIIAVTLPGPAFDGSTKDRLVNSETNGFVHQAFARHFRAFLQQHPTDAAAIVAKLQANLSAP